jgi:hypothetical protein
VKFLRRAWELRYEESRNLIIADLFHGTAHYATIWRAKLPGAVERVTAEAQTLVNQAMSYVISDGRCRREYRELIHD